MYDTINIQHYSSHCSLICWGDGQAVLNFAPFFSNIFVLSGFVIAWHGLNCRVPSMLQLVFLEMTPAPFCVPLAPPTECCKRFVKLVHNFEVIC